MTNIESKWNQDIAEKYILFVLKRTRIFTDTKNVGLEKIENLLGMKSGLRRNRIGT